jgi:uncharacterized membrane protein YobD (UPF0266 family)
MNKKTLFIALFLFALAGLMLHLRIHYFMVPVSPGAETLGSVTLRFDATRFLSFIFPLLDVVVVTLLFTSRSTAVYGYLLNGMIVIYGTVFMGHFSIAELTARSAPLFEWIGKSTIPDIAIAWGDFLVGKSLYDVYMRG